MPITPTLTHTFNKPNILSGNVYLVIRNEFNDKYYNQTVCSTVITLFINLTNTPHSCHRSSSTPRARFFFPNVYYEYVQRHQNDTLTTQHRIDRPYMTFSQYDIILTSCKLVTILLLFRMLKKISPTKPFKSFKNIILAYFGSPKK